MSTVIDNQISKEEELSSADVLETCNADDSTQFEIWKDTHHHDHKFQKDNMPYNVSKNKIFEKLSISDKLR